MIPTEMEKKRAEIWQLQSQLARAEARAATLETAVNNLWDHLRSTHAVGERKGEHTNWEAFHKKTEERITEAVKALGFVPKAPNMFVTAKSFRMMPHDE